MADAVSPNMDAATFPKRGPLQIVLIGAGHTHLQIVEWWRRHRIPGAELTLLSAFDRAAYSGMVPGSLAGVLSPHEYAIDLTALTQRQGVAMIVDRAVALDPIAHSITCAHHPAIHYDVASINIGSVPQAESLCQTHRSLVSIKPLLTFTERFEKRLGDWRSQQQASGSDAALRLVIVGGGASGIEIALCVAQKLNKEGSPAEIILMEGRRELWSGASRRARYLARQALERSQIATWLGHRVVDCDEDGPTALVREDGVRVPCDLAIWATGAAPLAVAGRFGLPISERGFLAVRSTLQSTGADDVFAVGDTAELSGADLSKAGVYAVRQGPILFQNLHRLVAGKPLINYEPQPTFLSLLGCGDGTAIVDYKGWSFRSRWAWRLKRWIDRRFVRRFR